MNSRIMSVCEACQRLITQAFGPDEAPQKIVIETAPFRVVIITDCQAEIELRAPTLAAMRVVRP